MTKLNESLLVFLCSAILNDFMYILYLSWSIVSSIIHAYRLSPFFIFLFFFKIFCFYFIELQNFFLIGWYSENLPEFYYFTFEFSGCIGKLFECSYQYWVFILLKTPNAFKIRDLKHVELSIKINDFLSHLFFHFFLVLYCIFKLAEYSKVFFLKLLFLIFQFFPHIIQLFHCFS